MQKMSFYQLLFLFLLSFEGRQRRQITIENRSIWFHIGIQDEEDGTAGKKLSLANRAGVTITYARITISNVL